MAAKSIPDGYHSVTPYLVVEGAGRLIDFLKQAFNAEEKERFGRPDGAIMHAEVRVGDSIIMMGDASAEVESTRSSIHLYVDDVDATYKRAIQTGAASLREPQDQFYGDRSAGVKDAFGNSWWLATHIEDVSAEELQRRQAAMAQA